MTDNAKIKKIAAAIRKMDDEGTALAWAAYDADLLIYEDASPPAKSLTTAKAIAFGWADADTSDAVGDILAGLESDAPNAVTAIWDALLG